MPRYRLTLAYDGTEFEGFQLQAGERESRTIQGELEQALSRLQQGERVTLFGAGRTDAGVHALGQVVCFDLERHLEPVDLRKALNGLLPRDVRVRDAALAPPDFHARKDARSKLYRYQIDLGAVPLPHRRRYALHVSQPLALARMKEAALLFLGRRDFASLASTGGSASTTVRTVTRSEWIELETEGVPVLHYEIEADGFLRKMVRSVVGGMLAVGRGAATPAVLEYELHAKDRRRWPAPAEAHGLWLVRVDYENAVLHYRGPEGSC